MTSPQGRTRSRRPLPRSAEAARLEAELARILRRERVAGGWTQGRLANAIGISQSLVCRYETLTALRPRVDVYARAFDALQIAIRLDARRLHEAARRDRGHAFVLAYVLRRLPVGWLTDSEVAVRSGQRSGWIDLLLFHPRSGTLLVVEIKTEVHDLGEILRTLRWHAGLALAAAHSRGWRPRSVVPVLIVLATHEAIDRLVEARRLLLVALPGDARDLLLSLRVNANPDARDVAAGSGLERRGYAALIDPLSRRQQWLSPVPVTGRVARPRWRGYADFVRDIERRRIRTPAASPA